ncbi:ATP-binding cassette domain-containing protein [Rhodobacterales bacterium HKCCE2091]|nr:ATP-binding cassette domain-containing protein [Rhodobacterales bacterium HKCCE2091]
MIGLRDIAVVLGEFRLEMSLDLPKGARLAVVGASGSGKSTLLNAVAGFVAADAGRIEIDGRDVTGTAVAERPVSILFQDGNLFPHLSVFDNVALGLRPDLRQSPGDRAAVDTALAQVGLDGFGPRRPGSLSGGQEARTALARMLLRDRPVALMDEPFASLDPALRAEMAGLVQDLCEARGMTLMMVTHDLRGLETLATHVLLLAEGRAAAFGPAEALRADPPAALLPWL